MKASFLRLHGPFQVKDWVVISIKEETIPALLTTVSPRNGQMLFAQRGFD